MQRMFFANVHPTPLDGSGRILLPEKLRTLAGIQREVVMVGVADRAEIWDRARWEKFESDNDARFDELDVVLVGNGGSGSRGSGGGG
jgi:MraZ protein